MRQIELEIDKQSFKEGLGIKDVDMTPVIDSISKLEKAILDKKIEKKDTKDLEKILKQLVEKKVDNTDIIQAIDKLALTINTDKVEIDYTVKFNELMDTITSSNRLRPGYNPSVPQIRNVAGETINPSTSEKQDEIISYHENHICTDNTTSTPLGANEVFTGVWQDCLQFQEVNVSISTDKNSATNGLEIQWSDNGVDVADKDNFTVYANAGTNYTPNPAFRYVRLKYTNGSVAQGTFRLMTILRRGMTGGSFHRITDTLKDDSDARLGISVLKLRTAQDNYVSGSATNSGNFKVSLEESEINLATEDTLLDIKTAIEAQNNNYTLRLAESGVYTYIGEAVIGSSAASAVWRVKRLDETSGLIILWADGNENFDNVWNNYATLTYN